MTGAHPPPMPPDASNDTAHDRPHGSAWLVLAAHGPAYAIKGHGGAEVVVVDSDERFVRVLLGEPPRSPS